MNFQPGDDVTVTFDGIDSPGVIERVLPSGWIQARIIPDMAADYGSITARMAPESIVCVRVGDVKPKSE